MTYPLDLLAPLPAGRVCGPCTACCRTLVVPELAKGERVDCPHRQEAGCAIHGEHPASCQAFRCTWLAGQLQGDERRRPDQLGLLFHLALTAVGAVLAAWELRPGARDEPAGRYLLDKLSRKGLVCLFPYAGAGQPQPRLFLGPAGGLARVAAHREKYHESPL